ncbi:SH2 domain-containing protein 4A [Protopterus annectens]|uniref:SH2 domain-containing protein 4A n=1 Tax=Protopterus annectens TaxID=7888 RepID=UPI001CFB50F5|nr:SH2 domain-containing protein 4A [Protopterus annectens]
MLKQILETMYIDPELLAELSEEQKQILFFKMREEQIRRWKERETKLLREEENQKIVKPKKDNGKCVHWLHGKNDDVWVWVMGEHPLDKPYDHICDEIIAERARLQAQKEAEELRRANEEALAKSLSNSLILQKQKEAEEAQRSRLAERQAVKQEEEARRAAAAEQERLQMELKKKEEEEKKQEEELKQKEELRTQELYITIKEAQEAVLQTEKEDPVYQEMLRKSKAADERRRSIAKQARDDYKRLSMQGIERGKVAAFAKIIEGEQQPPPIPPRKSKLNNTPDNNNSKVLQRKMGIKRTTSKSTKEEIVRWFRDDQLLLHAGYEKSTNSIAPWFHGIIPRQEAEDLLTPKKRGSFLIRVSERIQGYALSYRSDDAIRHFLIDASGGFYGLLGVDQMQHTSLAELVEYHKAEEITSLGKEKLLFPCGQKDNHRPDYEELFQ